MLNVFHLKYFCDAARAGSVSEAAKINRVSHSAVSQAIKSLEGALGFKLLRHAKRHFEITPQGNMLLARAEAVFDGVEALSALGKGQAPVSGQLRIGLSHSVGADFLASPLAEFLSLYPEVEPTLKMGNSSSLERLLATREIEIGFGIDDGSFPRFERRELTKGNFVLAARGERAEKRFLVGDKGIEVKSLLSHLRDSGEKPVILTAQSWSMIAALAARGAGIALVPDFILASHKGLTRVRRSVVLPDYRLSAFFRSEAALSPGAKALVDHLSRKVSRGG